MATPEVAQFADSNCPVSDCSFILEALRMNNRTLCNLLLFDTFRGRPLGCQGAVDITAMGFDVLSKLADAIAGSKQLKGLYFTGTGRGLPNGHSDQCLLIAKALQRNSTIKRVMFAVAGLREDDLEAVLGMLQQNTSIKELCLELNRQVNPSDLVIRAFTALQKNTTLVSLFTSDATLVGWPNLDASDEDDEDDEDAFAEFEWSLEQIRDALEENTTLRHFMVDLFDPRIRSAFDPDDCIVAPPIEPLMERNRSLFHYWGAVSQIVRGSASRTLQQVVATMGPCAFCKMIFFSFFLSKHISGPASSSLEISTMFDVIQEVTHDMNDPPAEVLEEEAVEIVSASYAQHIEVQIGQGHVGAVEDASEVNEQNYMLIYAHHPAEFLYALMEGPPLKHCRDNLAAVGHSSLLPQSGAKVVVRPHQWQSVMTVLQGRDLGPYHVIVAAEFEHLVEESILSIRCKRRPRVKKGGRELLPPPEHEEVQADEDDSEVKASEAFHSTSQGSNDLLEELFAYGELEVKRTFLCVVFRLRGETSVTQSTISHYEDPVRGSRNPCRCDPVLCQQ